MQRTAHIIAMSLLISGCSVFGIRSGTEQPTYEIVAQLVETIEVRRYPPRVAAEALVEAADEKPARNAAFRLLFDYISGANRSNRQIAMTTPVETAAASEKIAMTVPVESARTGEATLRMRFFLPTGLDLESTPAPLDPRVRIVALPGQTVAALRFSGSRGRDAVAEKTTQLLRALAETPWRPTAEPVAYFYDPPWTLPFLRRNEVVVAVER